MREIIELDEICEDCGTGKVVFVVEDEEDIRDEIVRHGMFCCQNPTCGSESFGSI